ncbi:16833_t:CDS:2, partial [Cetraspora pellucida]
MNTVDQPKSDILLENNKIKKIIAKLPDESLYAPETAQIITTYLQVIDESVVTEEILDDKEIISIVQADENKELKNSESNLSFEELGFLRNLLKEYKYLYFQDPYTQDLYSQDLYSQDLYSQNLYFQDSYSQ